MGVRLADSIQFGVPPPPTLPVVFTFQSASTAPVHFGVFTCTPARSTLVLATLSTSVPDTRNGSVSDRPPKPLPPIDPV